MELPKDYDEITGITGEYETLEAGGYICKIISAKEEKSQTGKRMLVIAFDIANGEHEGIYKRKYDEAIKLNNDPSTKVKWPNNGIYRLMLEDSEGRCNRFFKGFITSVEQSNNNYNFKEAKADEKTLKDKLFGGVFGEEEYEGFDGKIKTTTKLRWIRTINAIEDGKYQIPDPIKLNRNNIFNENNTNENDDDLPF